LQHLLRELEMKKLCFLSVLAGLNIVSASAADFRLNPAADIPGSTGPAYDWSGFYAGLNVGAGWNRDRGSQNCIDNFGVVDGPLCQIVPGPAVVHASGVIGGGQIGYNWQYNRTVVGLEADFQGSGIGGATKVNGPFRYVGYDHLALPAGAYTASEKLDWFGTLRGHLGFAATDRTLVYVTGGLAYGSISASSNFTAPNVGTDYPGWASATHIGWTAGGGVEFALTGDLTTRLEGLYYNLGSVAVTGQETPALFTPYPYQHNKTFDANGVIVRIGLNYRFGGPAIR
jgi:outer membrane immunogenic protein